MEGRIKRGMARKFSPTFIGLGGFALMFVGQGIKFTFLKVDVGALIVNVGALLLVVGILQWLFDEDSREELVNHVSDRVVRRLDEHDHCARLGIHDCLADAKDICGPQYAEDIQTARILAIGFQYSDSLIGRYQRIIQNRIDANLQTQLVHLQPNGAAAAFLAQWTKHPIDLQRKVSDLLDFVSRTFRDSDLVRLISHDVVIRYTFVYTESAIWLTFMSNSHMHQALIPAIKVENPSPLYDFLKSDIEAMGVTV